MKRGASWPIAVVAILATGVAANVWLIRLAGSDPSFAIEEDYYQKALHWDDELAQRARNDSLGWQLSVDHASLGADAGAAVRVGVRDAQGAPVAATSLTVRAVHVARAGDPLDVAFVAVAPGDFVARLPMHRVGIWELRFDVRRGEDRFTARRRIETSPAAP